MKNILLVLLTFSFFSCNFNKKKDTSYQSEYCLTTEKNKVICFDQPIDTNSTYIYIDEFGIKDDIKDLSLNYMMVVDIQKSELGNIVILSNIINSVSIKWTGTLPKIQDMYYVICTDRILKESVLVKYPNVIEDDTVIIEEP